VAATDETLTQAGHPALVRLLVERSEREPGSVALRVKRLGLWQETTWRRLATSVRDLALGLAAAGVGAGDAVAILAEATPESLAADLAVQALGGSALPISPDSSIADVRRLLSLGGVRALVVGDLETLDRLAGAPELDGAGVELAVIVEGIAVRGVHDWRLLSFAELAAAGREGARPETLADLVAGRRGEEPMSLHPTAGTSGLPRLVRISSAAFAAAWSELFTEFGASSRDAFVVEAPLSHVAGRAAALLLPLLFGAVAHFPEHPAAVDEAMAEVAPTISIALPQRWERRVADLETRVRESGPLHRWAYRASLDARRWSGPGRWLVLDPIRRKLGLRRLRVAAVGGRHVPADLLDFWRRVGVPLVEFYSATEACGIIAFQPRPAPSGRGFHPLSRVQVRIGADGEIEIGGAHAPGGWLGTGDRGSLADDGTLTLDYRLSDVIAVKGREVPIGEIERALRAQGHIRHVTVVGRDRPFLAALVELDFPSVAAWARANAVRYGSLGSLAGIPEVVALIASAVESANAGLRERGLPPVQEFAVLGATEGFEAADVLALTGEVRRGEVEDRYRATIESLYARTVAEVAT
jgi:long-chain acyl-CoA synthetase